MSVSNSSAVCSEALLREMRKECSLFSGVNEELWAETSVSFRTQFYRDGETICREGDPADALLIVRRGEVEISRDRIHLAVRREGEVIGEQALIERIARGATMTAKGLVQLVVVPADAFSTFLKDAAFSLNLLRMVSEKLNQATRQRAFRFAVEQLLFSEFKAHVARPVLDELLAQREDYGRPRSIDGIVLFSDIRGFSTRSATLDPERVARELGSYLEHAVEVIHRHGGLVDKFIGDAVMAIWGWPAQAGTDRYQAALSSACELAETAAQFSLGGVPIAIGVGLNAGPMFIGNVGSGDKRQFTVLGAAVNLAARYESASKDLGAPIVMGETFVERLGSQMRESFIAHANCPVKGAESQTLYTPSSATIRAIAIGK
jgi:class 3 adenylate cyclase